VSCFVLARLKTRLATSIYADLFGCGQGQFPIRYLGIPIHYRRPTLTKWKLVKERLQKHLSSWKDKLLSIGGWVLINSILSNMALYMISFFLLPKGILHRLDYYRSRFFWQGDSEKSSINSLNRVWFVHLKI
jgi:hypothetical protein